MSEQSTDYKPVVKIETRPIAVILAVFIVIWCWANREHLIPGLNTAHDSHFSDIEFVKASPFPDNPITPVGFAYESVTSSNTWKEFKSPRGVRVVQFEGLVNDSKVREKILDDTWNIKEACEMLPSVEEFIESMKLLYKNFDADDFHTVVFDPNMYAEIAGQAGFDEASQEYLEANKNHFDTEVTISTQFLVFVKRETAKPSILGGHEGFTVGASSVSLSSGIFSWEPLRYNDLTDLVQKN